MTTLMEQPEVVEAVLKARKEIARNSIHAFGAIYLPHHLTKPPASFHKELYKALEDHSRKRLVIEGFRQSAKTTISTLIFPLWAALLHPEKYPFTVIASDTSTQSRLLIAAIRYELEHNEMLKKDYGDQTIHTQEWTKSFLVLSNGAAIIARSRGQKMRGLKYRQHRPTLIIVDDPEDSKWVKQKQNRDDTERWFRTEVILAQQQGDKDYSGRIILIGNLLHKDALLARASMYPEWEVLRFPAIKNGKPTWKEEFPLEKLQMIRNEVGEVLFQREYLLRPVADEGAPIEEGWLHWYDPSELPKDIVAYSTGIDLAISQKESADYTAMVSIAVDHDGKEPRFWVLPHPVNARLDFADTIATAKSVYHAHAPSHILFVEAVAYQKAAVETMRREGLPVEEVHPSKDKLARLRTILPFIKNGNVRFPRHGAEELLEQLLGFGVEEHDDLVDALVMAIQGAVSAGLHEPLRVHSL